MSTTNVTSSSSPARPAEPESSVARLAAEIEPVLAAQGISGVITMRPLDIASSYGIIEVTVEDEGGHRHRYLLKDFSNLLVVKRRIAERARREIGLYADLLGHLPGAARYIGSNADGESAWLLLEFVSGEPLKHHPLEVWLEAVHWLGDVHRRVAERLAGSPPNYVKVHGERYFGRVITRAIEVASTVDTGIAAELRASSQRFERIGSFFRSTPQTLVHGSFGPRQILVRDGADDRDDMGSRICPIDWENAAFGSCLYDLARFVDGFEGIELRAFWDAYLRARGDDATTFEELQRAMSMCRLHRTLKWLGQSIDRDFGTEAIYDLASDALQQAANT